ncbi:alpha/beta hydrolase [Gordonia sp. X0973]|uniref:alpha/beta fold hydrolase n=1 Tax=Gordonia sp. X0973 TaxID=2742602 RepID=UPI000F538A57|nr:alpha/beta hydrolase [Gordonia sp. X0973]QKT08281.1 alpha/beta hydrolase [Gordonia sp. X0973]
MSSFVLVPGAGGQAWYFHRLVSRLVERGHRAVAVDLPADDDTAGLAEYAAAIVDASPSGPVILVAQSMGGLSAPLTCDRLDVAGIVMLNAMSPRPGEAGGDWWTNTGQEEAARSKAIADGRDPDAPFDPSEVFFHDADPELLAEAQAAPPPRQSGRPFDDPWPLEGWPDVPTRFIGAVDDRLFPLEFQRRVVGERLGVDVETAPGGHLAALTQPEAVVERLLR